MNSPVARRFALFFPCSLFFLCALWCTAGGAAEQRPNVVMIMTDNHGAWTLGCYGNPDIRTPHIDQLAAEGTLFENAFACNPVCSPTRATVLTGLVPSQHGVHCFLRGGRLQIGPDARNTLEDFTSMPEVLRSQGYRCGLVGKWHLGANMTPQEGFDDYWITMPHGGTSTFYDAQIIENGQLRREPEYLTDFWTRHAVNFITDSAERNDKPFFLFLSYNGPYSLSRLLLREGRNRHAEFYRDRELSSFPRETAHPWQLHNRDYQNNPVSISRVATEVSGVDDGVGTVMKTLKAHGLDENTIVIFLADQGWVGGHGGFFGMGDHTRPVTARDGMMQIPMIWRHPGKIAAGHRTKKLVANYDVLPTLLDHLGVLPTWVNRTSEPISPGKSRKVEFDTKSETAPNPDDAVFYEFESLRCIRTHDWKYTHRYPNGPHELYDLKHDADELDNLFGRAPYREIQTALKKRLDDFYGEFASPKYDLWNDGGSQTFIYDGIEEEIAQTESTPPPALPADFTTHEFTLPNGFSAELAAGPPLVTHPTMGCLDDAGNLFVCNNAGVNMSAEDLEENLPNAVNRLVDSDGDGIYDTFTVFADRMTFPMGGAWHDGALYVASPPNIWRLEDTDDDGVADKRDVIVDKFGFTGNAASIHGCFFSPDGRLYWCDGYHGHEFTDGDGNVLSKRKGSYIFSCWPDGSDVRIHCGGGMDNPVEVDFTDEGDVIGTVNILYTRPRIDCLVHWQYGGAYPHREAVLDELKITGDLLEPIHKFGHVAISGTTRYRSGVMDHRWRDNFFATEFNLGKVVRVELERNGSTYSATEREFLSCNNRDFHPTDVLEDADGSLLVIDTGGWFYRGCPTSQIAKPDVLGGIYRIRRDGMTPQVDPRGLHIDWAARTDAQLMRDLKGTRYAVRERAIQECVRRGEKIVARLISTVRSADIEARRNAIWAATRIVHANRSAGALMALLYGLTDRDPGIRQTAWHGLGASKALTENQLPELSPDARQLWSKAFQRMLQDEESAAVRREAFATLAVLKLGDFRQILASRAMAADTSLDREERHAIMYAVLEASGKSLQQNDVPHSMLIAHPDHLIVFDQLFDGGVSVDVLEAGIAEGPPDVVLAAAEIAQKRSAQKSLAAEEIRQLNIAAARRIQQLASAGSAITDPGDEKLKTMTALIQATGNSEHTGEAVAVLLDARETNDIVRKAVLEALATSGSITLHDLWKEPLIRLLQSPDPALRIAAIRAAGNLGAVEFSDRLFAVSTASSEVVPVRTAALQAVVNGRQSFAERVFPLLLSLATDGTIDEQRTAAELLGSSALSVPQLEQVVPLLSNSGPQQLVDLVKLFKRTLKADLAASFLTAMENARSLNSVPMIEVSEVVKRFPQELHDRANALLDRMKAAEQQKLRKLDTVVAELKHASADRGRDIFFSEKSKCATCHVVGTKGKRVGPDLTTIGANRSSKDLLESIVFPSSTLVRQYEPYTVVTSSGRSFTGLIVRDTVDAVHIQPPTGESIRIPRDDIDELIPGTVSIMPKGLDESLTPLQIADMVTWLQGLK